MRKCEIPVFFLIPYIVCFWLNAREEIETRNIVGCYCMLSMISIHLHNARHAVTLLTSTTVENRSNFFSRNQTVISSKTWNHIFRTDIMVRESTWIFTLKGILIFTFKGILTSRKCNTLKIDRKICEYITCVYIILILH